MKLTRFLFLSCAVLMSAANTFAQTQFGQISGRVADATDAVVVGAKVAVRNVATGAVRIAESNHLGMYAVANVGAGRYEITVEKNGFRRSRHIVKAGIAQRIQVSFSLVVGAASDSVEVVEERTSGTRFSGGISRAVGGQELENLPLLTRNPYELAQLTPGAVNTGAATGDTNGIGVSVAGSRNRSVNFLLDGSENNETFATGPSTLIPVFAIEEFKIQANTMTAEFGRNTVQANVVTKSGSNDFHGSLYEFYRGSALSSHPVEDKANGLPKSPYVRNVFGGTFGGPLKKSRSFFFGALEGTRVRSTGRNSYYVPTQEFAANASANMNAYLDAGGGLPSPNLPGVLTASQIVAVEQGNDGMPYGADAQHSLFNASQALIPGNTPLFQRTFVDAPIDAGGGQAQNTWSLLTRADHQMGDSTSLMARWAWYRQLVPVGGENNSPFAAFNTGSSVRSQNAGLSLSHSFNSRLAMTTRLTYSRTSLDLPLGQGQPNLPCFQYGLSGSLGTGDQMVFPGYVPAQCAAFFLPSGGPQNTYSGYTGFSYQVGRHIVKWGAYGRHMRDNHTFGASAQGAAITSAMQNTLQGQVDSFFSLAIDPRGHVPGESYSTAVDGPLMSPSFTRHHRYNEIALYAEDQIKLTPRVTLTAGLRWEYFGVLHSPEQEKFLDANFYFDMAGMTSGQKGLYEQIRDGRFARTNNFFNPDYNNLAPRLGLSWDVRGNGQTIARAGYGIYYDANFGNALFNAIQNSPNYAVAQIFGDGSLSPLGPILPNQFDALTILAGGSAFPISGSARMLDRGLVTAYYQQWNATIERSLMGKALFATVAYVGSKGDKLYSLNNLNQRGSCILLEEAHCNGNPMARLNQSGVTGINRRGNEGFSRYHALQTELKTGQIPGLGLQLAANYSWAHMIDNATSFFNDSAFDANGNFGFSNPFNPAGDRADSSIDIRHRFTMSYVWRIPAARAFGGTLQKMLGGWGVSGIFSAQTGAAFSVYEDLGAFNDVCSASVANACYPVVTGKLPVRDGATPAGSPNRFRLYDFSGSLTSLADYCGGDPGCTQQTYYFGQKTFLNRNTFRAPGYWNLDLAMMKDVQLPGDRAHLQFRAEFFNAFNHSNLYADPNTNVLSAGQVLARRGVNPGSELYGVVNERRNIQLGLRLQF